MNRSIKLAAAAALAFNGWALSGVWAEQPGHQDQQRIGQERYQQDRPGMARPAGARIGMEQEELQKVQETLANTAVAILERKDLRQLRQQFTERDRERLQDLDRHSEQIEQAVDELRQAYRQRYDQDLNLHRQRELVFAPLPAFFHVGEVGEAVPAGVRVPGEPQPGLTPEQRQRWEQQQRDQQRLQQQQRQRDQYQQPGTQQQRDQQRLQQQQQQRDQHQQPGAQRQQRDQYQQPGARIDDQRDPFEAPRADRDRDFERDGVGVRDRDLQEEARIAAERDGRVGERTKITIPGQLGQPDTRIPLVRENNEWRIDVPDQVTAQQLAQNLQRQITQATQQRQQWPEDANLAAQQIAQQVFAAFGDQQMRPGFEQPGVRQPGVQQPGQRDFQQQR